MVEPSNGYPSDKAQMPPVYSSIGSQDVEALKASVTVESYEVSIPRRGSVVEAEITKVRDIQNSFAPLRILRAGEEWLDAKLGVESRGVNRIAEEEKRPPSIVNIFLFWWSLNVHPGALPLGILGPQFGLSLSASIWSAVIGNMLGALCTAFTGTLGPKLGLRQIACARYSFGYWGAMLASVFNIVIGVGFNVISFVLVGQMLSAVADYRMTISVGIIVIGIISYLISVFGYRTIHAFMKYVWIYNLPLLIVLLVQVTPHVDSTLPSDSSGLVYAGSYLTILAINFSSSSGWCSVAADYYCNYPSTTSSLLVFFLTWTGIVIPTTFSLVIGSMIGNAAITAKYPPYAAAYEEHYLGGLLREIYHPIEWSRCALVLLIFSVLGNNVVNFYSTGLSLQLFGSYFLAVPRLVWSLLVAIVISVLACAGAEHLSSVLQDFVSMLGYWTISFTIILLVEDKWFRRRTGYNLHAWNSSSELPLGVAAVTSLIVGYLVGGMLGMSQVWYVGPIARKFSADGGDMGIWLSGAITLIVYPVARTIEKNMTGR